MTDELIAVKRRDLESLRQRIHLSYHELSGTNEKCSHPVCVALCQLLAEAQPVTVQATSCAHCGQPLGHLRYHLSRVEDSDIWLCPDCYHEEWQDTYSGSDSGTGETLKSREE